MIIVVSMEQDLMKKRDLRRCALERGRVKDLAHEGLYADKLGSMLDDMFSRLTNNIRYSE